MEIEKKLLNMEMPSMTFDRSNEESYKIDDNKNGDIYEKIRD